MGKGESGHICESYNIVDQFLFDSDSLKLNGISIQLLSIKLLNFLASESFSFKKVIYLILAMLGLC